MVPALPGTAALAAILLVAAGCGTDAVGVQACRQVQEARCRQAPACNISLQPPYHGNGSDTDACIRFYNDQCLHGLASGADPGPIAVNACVAAINHGGATPGGCSVVLNPQTAEACSWLASNSSSGDAGAGDAPADVADSGAIDAGSD
jgi:hypothetical protein